MNFAEARRELIKKGEGSISHMYLDARGFVTVGVGKTMRTAADAQVILFVRRDNGTPATAEEIAMDFNAIKSLPYGQGYAASAFKSHTALDLPEAEIDALLDNRIANLEAGLRSDFSGYDRYPDRARLGLMDMAFNLGNHGLVTKFPTFTAAARAGIGRNAPRNAAAAASARCGTKKSNSYSKERTNRFDRLSTIQS